MAVAVMVVDASASRGCCCCRSCCGWRRRRQRSDWWPRRHIVETTAVLQRRQCAHVLDAGRRRAAKRVRGWIVVVRHAVRLTYFFTCCLQLYNCRRRLSLYNVAAAALTFFSYIVIYFARTLYVHLELIDLKRNKQVTTDEALYIEINTQHTQLPVPLLFVFMMQSWEASTSVFVFELQQQQYTIFQFVRELNFRGENTRTRTTTHKSVVKQQFNKQVTQKNVYKYNSFRKKRQMTIILLAICRRVSLFLSQNKMSTNWQ